MNDTAVLPIAIENLDYSVGKKNILTGVSFSLVAGRTVGLLGLNGAGKTSLIQIILGLSSPKNGTATLFGTPTIMRKAFDKVGYAPEEPSFPDFLTVQEYMDFVSRVRGLAKPVRRNEVARQLAEFELEGNKKIRDLSKGMRRKLSLAQAFIGSPELMILDEPLNGLDPLAIVKLRETILDAKKRGVSLLVSSHILSEVEKICDEVVILKQGKVELAASVDTLSGTGKTVEIAFTEIHKTS